MASNLRILGLDPGLAHTGWAVLACDGNPRLITSATIETRKWLDRGKTIEIANRDRIDAISLDVQKVLAVQEPDYVVMEDFVFFGNRGKTTSIMPALVENIRVMGKMLGYNVVIFTNAAWKKILLRNHIASKEQIQYYTHKQLGLQADIWDAKDKGGHERDAMALALTLHKKLSMGEDRDARRTTVRRTK